MENKGFYINDLPQSGEVTFLAAVIEKELRPKRNGGSFLSVRLADRSGELDAKVWDNPETVAQLFDCNDVVKVRGAMEHYNDKPQLIVSRIRRCEPQEYTASDFYPASIRDPEEMFGELEAFVVDGARRATSTTTGVDHERRFHQRAAQDSAGGDEDPSRVPGRVAGARPFAL